MTSTVTGRNGYLYDAKHIGGKLHVVGKFIVVVEDNQVTDTICKATKANIKNLAR